MIDQFIDIVRPVKSLPDVMNDLLRSALEELSAQLEDANIAQMQQGIRSDGTPIEPGYTPFTIAIKKSKGQPTDVVTLKDEGNFYRGMRTEFDNEGVEFYSNDSKTDALELKYGSEIFGLTEQSIEKFNEDYLIERLQAKLNEHFDD